MIKNQVHAFIGFLRLYQDNNYSIILTLENYKVKYSILDSDDNEVTDIQGVDWYDLSDVMRTLELLEFEASEKMFSDTDMATVIRDNIKKKLNKLYGRGEEK